MAQNKVEGYSGSGSSAGATGRSASPLEGAVPSLEGAVPPLEGAALESMTGRAFPPALRALSYRYRDGAVAVAAVERLAATQRERPSQEGWDS